jgi:hypothetical protein
MVSWGWQRKAIYKIFVGVWEEMNYQHLTVTKTIPLRMDKDLNPQHTREIQVVQKHHEMEPKAEAPAKRLWHII